MGDAADDEWDRLYDPNWRYDPDHPSRHRTFQAGSGDFKWRSVDGVLDMWQMSEQHLRNALAVAERYKNTAKAAQLRQVLNDLYGSSERDRSYQDFLKRIGEA